MFPREGWTENPRETSRAEARKPEPRAGGRYGACRASGGPIRAGGIQPDLKGSSPGSADPPTTAPVSPSRLPCPLQASVSASNDAGACLHLSGCGAPCCFP